MPTLNGRNYSGVPGLNIRSANGCIRFETPSITPTTTSGERILYCNSSNQLIYDDGSSSTALGASGAVISYGLNDAYDDGNSITVDGSPVTFANSGAGSTAVAYITGSAAATVPLLLFANSGSGNDVTGTSSLWSVSAAGAGIFASVATNTITASSTNPSNLTIDATGTGTITLGATSTGGITLTRAVTATASVTITGTADSNCLTVTAGDVLISNGKIALTNDDTDTAIAVVANSVTTGNAVTVTGNGVTTGSLLYLSMTEAGITSGTGGYIKCYDSTAGANQFYVGDNGATTITGNATGTAALTITAGDFSMADGAVSITNSADAATVTIVADAATDKNVIDVNADAVTSGVLLHLDTTAATFTGKYIQCYDGAADDFSVAADGATTITTSAAGTVGLTIAHAGTTGDAMQITCTALTTGDALQISQTAETFAAGELLKLTNTENGDMSSTPKTGNVASITSSCTMTTNSVTLDYDNLLVSRSDIANQGTKTLTAQGSALKILYTATNTAGTCTSTVIGLEVEMADGGTAAPTGDAVKITSVGVGAKALNIVSASTTVSDVLITGSGAKADNKACLEVTSTGATAAGGSLFRVASGASTPAAATSYLVDFDYSASTMTNNPISVAINSGSSTGAAVSVTGSGVGYSLATYNTNTGATGVQWYAGHQAGSSEADNDVIFTLHMAGACETAHTAVTYAKMIATAIDVSDGTEDGKLDFQVAVGGTPTSLLYVQSSTAGATTCVVGAAASTFAGSAAGTAALTVTNGDISLSAGKFISTTTADIYGLDVTVNKATATQGVAVFTNASTTSGKAVLELEQADLDKPYIKVSGATAITSATAGANGDVPAQVVGYLNIDVDGTERRIPYYAA